MERALKAILRASGQKPDPGRWPLGFFPDVNPWFPEVPRESVKGSASAFLVPVLIALFCSGLVTLWSIDVHGALDSVRALGWGERFVSAVVIAVMASGVVAMACVWLACLRGVEYVQFRAWRVGRVLPARVVSEHWSLRNILSWGVALFAVLASHGMARLSTVISHHKGVTVEYMDGGCRVVVRMFSHGSELRPGQFLWICEAGRPWPRSMVHISGEGDWRKTPIPDEVCAWLSNSLSAAQKGATAPRNPYSRNVGSY